MFFGDRAVFQRLASTQTGLLEEYYLHRDHLGSVDRLSFAGGNATSADTTYSFDAWGKRRLDSWAADPGDGQMGASQWTERGYTGNEHLDEAKLIHMNGRVQDPILGRMLSADPLLGDLADPQSLNRYSYVRNNPLALTDPSGFDPKNEPFSTENPDQLGNEIVVRTRQDPPPPSLTLVNYYLDTWTSANAGLTAGTMLEQQVNETPAPVLPLTRNEQDLIGGLAQSVRSVGPEGVVKVSGDTVAAIGRGLRGVLAIGDLYAPIGTSVTGNVRFIDSLRVAFGQHGWLVAGTAWIYRVRPGGEWDYKRTKGRFDTETRSGFANTGNFNYGATGRAAGLDATTLGRGGGLVQYLGSFLGGAYDSCWGGPGTSWTWGDDPVDQFWIARGVRYFDSGTWQE